MRVQYRFGPKLEVAQPRDIARHGIDLDVDSVANRSIAPCGHLFGMRDDIDAKIAAIHRIDRQRGAIERDRSLGGYEPGQILRCPKYKAGAVAILRHADNPGHAVNMTRHDMPAQFIAQTQGAFQIDAPANSPCGDIGRTYAFGRNIHVKPVAIVRPHRHHGQAHALASDGCP